VYLQGNQAGHLKHGLAGSNDVNTHDTNVEAGVLFLTEELDSPFYFSSAVGILVPIIGKIGMSYSTAKWVAPVSFVIDFAAQ
jgi:hypothetical protein